MNITINVSNELIAEVLRTAIETASGYWVRPVEDQDAPNYSAIVAGRDYILLDEKYGESGERFVLNSSSVKRGLELMAQLHRYWFTNLIEADYDITTADVLLQLSLLGKLHYDLER